MRICLIAEGSYPYIAGGVSSWIQSLVSKMPEHEFIILAISAKKSGNIMKYKLPSNIVEIVDVYLELEDHEKRKTNQKIKFDEEDKMIFINVILGKENSWNALFKRIDKYKKIHVIDFLMSNDFYDIVKYLAVNEYPYVVFNHFFWTIRSMMITVFQVIKIDIPKADIYHSVSTGYAGLIGAMAKECYGSNYLITEHGIYTREREEEIIKADWVQGYFKDNWINYFYNLSSCAYQHADRILTLFGLNKKIQIELGCNPEKLEIIHNGVKVTNFDDAKAKYPYQSSNHIRIGAIVRVVPIKDIKTLIQAFSIAKKTIPDLELFIIGPFEEDLEYKLECDNLVEMLDVKDVIFTGRVNIFEYVFNMDFLVLSSISEGQPLAILEGMAASKAFITTDVGACRELIYGDHDEFGRAGIVVPVMGFNEMAQAMVYLSQHKEERHRMGQEGYKRVAKYYTEEAFINAYKEIYLKMGR